MTFRVHNSGEVSPRPSEFRRVAGREWWLTSGESGARGKQVERYTMGRWLQLGGMRWRKKAKGQSRKEESGGGMFKLSVESAVRGRLSGERDSKVASGGWRA